MNRFEAEENKHDDVPGREDDHEDEPRAGFTQREIDLADTSYVPILSSLWQTMPPGAKLRGNLRIREVDCSNPSSATSRNT